MNNFFKDTLIMAKRVILHSTRSIDTIMAVIVMPILLMITFTIIFGGAIDTGSIKYINFIIPGIMILSLLNGIAYTAFRDGTFIFKSFFHSN